MAQLLGTNIIAPIMPGDTLDIFPTHMAEYGSGGFLTVGTIAARNNIPAERREELMLVAVIEDGKVYQLVGGLENDNWVEYSLSVSSSSALPEYEAGENLSGHRVVMSDAYGVIWYASNASVDDANCILGITTGAISVGTTGPVKSHGDMTEPTWAWVAKKPLYLGESGFMVQTPPVSAFIIKVGYAVSATRIFIDIDSPIERV